MKYVVLLHNELGVGQEIPYLFPDYITHAELPACIARVPSSAGFIDQPHSDGLKCFGNSVSTGLSSRPEDADLIKELHVMITEDLVNGELYADAPKGCHWKSHGEHHMVVSLPEQDERWDRLFSQMAEGLGRCAGCCHYWAK